MPNIRNQLTRNYCFVVQYVILFSVLQCVGKNVDSATLQQWISAARNKGLTTTSGKAPCHMLDNGGAILLIEQQQWLHTEIANAHTLTSQNYVPHYAYILSMRKEVPSTLWP